MGAIFEISLTKVNMVSRAFKKIIFIKGRKILLSQPHETLKLRVIVSEPTLGAIFEMCSTKVKLFYGHFIRKLLRKGGPTGTLILYRIFYILLWSPRWAHFWNDSDKSKIIFWAFYETIFI